MCNLILFNGSRKQTAELMKNKHYFEKRRVDLEAFEASNRREFNNIKFDRASADFSKDFIEITIGEHDATEEGKTGVINVFLSGTLAEALENYHAIKAGLDVGHAYELEDKFFVTSNMKPIQLTGYARWAVVIEMCKVMEVQSITFTRNRHAVATRMSAVDAKGDSGMQHSEETRKDYYDDRKEAQGIRNKILDNVDN